MALENAKRTVVKPCDHQDMWAILDYNAVVKHCAAMGNDPDAVYGSVTGREVNTAEHTFRAFLDAYFVPILECGFAPRQILVAHDDGHEYRSKILPDYKGKRDARKKDGSTDPEKAEQYKKADALIKPFLAYMGCTQAMVPGVEGDDIIGYFNKLPGKKQIFTVDADMLVLTDENTMLMMKNQPVLLQDFCLDDLPKNMHGFIKPFMVGDEMPEWNVFPLLTLYKSLVGDNSDEYGGIKGFGDKAWADAVTVFERDGIEELSNIVSNKDWTLLQSYLDHYESGDEKGCKEHKTLAKLFENRSAWRTCWIVAQLHPELCWKPNNKKMTEIVWYKRVPCAQHITQLLERAGALTYMEDLEGYLPQEWLIDANNFEEADIVEFAEMCGDTPHVSYDYEGYAERNENFVQASAQGENFVDVRGQKLTGMSLNFGNNLQYTCYITVGHAKSANLPFSVIRDFLDAIPDRKVKVAHNSIFEEVVTATNLDGFVLNPGSVHDTMIMSAYDNENRESHGLKKLSLSLLNYKQASYKETLDAAGAKNMSEVTADQCLKYGLDDSTCTGHIYDLLKLSLMLQETWEFYRDNEPYVNHRFAMSYVTGLDVDYEKLAEVSAEDRIDIDTKMIELRSILEDKCGRINRDAAQRFFDQDRKFMEASARKKYGLMDEAKFLIRVDNVAEDIEKMDIADETMMEIAQRIRLKVPAARGKKAKEARDLSGVEVKPLIAWVVKYDLHKVLMSLIEGSVYVPYEEKRVNPAFVPSVGQLNKAAEAVGLPVPDTAAKGKLDSWEADVRDVDFDKGTDNYESMTDIQKKFISLIRVAKDHFAPAKREDPEFLAFQDLCCELLDIEGNTYITGTELNLGSPKQMKEVLYCMLDLPVRLCGKPSDSRRDLGFWDGTPATDSLARATALSEDVSEHKEFEWKGNVINLINEITECSTRFSLYHNSYPLFKHPLTGRMHPGLRNCGTVTKRPSCSSPNILQVSKHQKKGVMRSIFIPPRGMCVIPIDFSGQELRIQASETRDPNLLSVYLGSELTAQYLSGEVFDITYNMVKDKTDLKDLHGLTASGITKHFGLDASGKLVAGGSATITWKPETYEDYMDAYFNKEHEFHNLADKVRKRPAKQTNFLLSYGGTDTTLSHRLIIPLDTATGIMNSTLTLYAGIVTAQENTLKLARENGYVCTAYGNRRHATEELFSKSKGPVNRQVRQLYNARIQGCAADILKVVLSECEKCSIWDRMNSVMVAPVYDEVVAFVPYEFAWDFVQEMRGIMNLTPPGHAVPMVADVSIGPNWQIQHELGHQPTREAFEKVLNEEVIPIVEATWDRIEGK